MEKLVILISTLFLARSDYLDKEIKFSFLITIIILIHVKKGLH